MDIQATGSGTVDVVVRGELDMHQAPHMRAVMTELLNRGDVIGINLDLSELTLLDAAGAGTVIVAHRIATNLRVALRLSAVSPIAARLLTLTGAGDLLPSPTTPTARLPAGGSGAGLAASYRHPAAPALEDRRPEPLTAVR